MNEQEINARLAALVEAVKQSEISRRFEAAEAELAKDPKLEEEVDHFRRKRFELSMSDEDRLIAEQNKLQDDYRNIFMKIPAAKEFLESEMDYCRLVRRIKEEFHDECKIDISFLNDSRS